MSDREPTEHELLEEEARRRRGQPTLDEEIAHRWDPERLSKLVVRSAGRGERLDLATRTEMEALLPGTDLSRVRVFRGPLAEEVTRHHRADAVTVANTGMILLRDTPRAAPDTRSGRALLAHELTHVAQAQRGLHFALAHEGGAGSHEEEAHGVEASVSEGQRDGDEDDNLEASRARNKMIIDRVLELIGEEAQIYAERSGRLWER